MWNLKKFLLTLALIGFMSCTNTPEKKELRNADKSDFITIDNLYESYKLESFNIVSQPKFYKYHESDGTVVYEVNHEFTYETRGVRGSLVSKIYEYPHAITPVEFELYKGSTSALSQLKNSDKIEFVLSQPIVNLNYEHELYEIYTDDSKFGYYLMTFKNNKIIMMNLYMLPFNEPNFQKLDLHLKKI